MVECPGCDGTFQAEDLTRHQLERLLIVHCPDCKQVLGQYRRHGDDPQTGS